MDAGVTKVAWVIQDINEGGTYKVRLIKAGDLWWGLGVV